MKQLQPDDEALLATLRKRVLITVRFGEDRQGFKYGDGVRAAVARAYEKRSLRDMRLIAGEIDRMTIGLPTDQLDGLEAIIKAQLGVDQEVARVEQTKHMAAVLRRGTIRNEKERRRLEEYLWLQEAIGGDPEEAESLRRLLRNG